MNRMISILHITKVMKVVGLISPQWAEWRHSQRARVWLKLTAQAEIITLPQLTTSYIGLHSLLKIIKMPYRQSKMNQTAGKLTLEIINNCNHHIQTSERNVLNFDTKLTQDTANFSCTVTQTQFTSVKIKLQQANDLNLILFIIIGVLILIICLIVCCTVKKTKRAKTDTKSKVRVICLTGRPRGASTPTFVWNDNRIKDDCKLRVWPTRCRTNTFVFIFQNILSFLNANNVFNSFRLSSENRRYVLGKTVRHLQDVLYRCHCLNCLISVGKRPSLTMQMLHF